MYIKKIGKPKLV